jgi:ATP-binding cassette subfamily C (CFTR/MRP) protein 1
MLYLKKYYFIQVYFIALIQIAPIAMPIVAFIGYAAISGQPLTPAIIFPALSLFNGLFQPILTIPQSLTSVVIASVSWKRLVEFLMAEEASFLSENVKVDSGSDIVLDVEHGYFKWEKVLEEKPKDQKKSKKDKEKKNLEEKNNDDLGETQFELKDICLKIKKGSKVAIVGPVGSGKSSLLSALIGEMPKTQGSIALSGSYAYCCQQAWILTETIQGNILFNSELDQSKLDSIINSIGFEPDLELFPSGVMTEIGEKGVNLSGGQKARVALVFRN